MTISGSSKKIIVGILESYFTSEALAHYVVLAQMPVLISDFFFIVHSRIDGMTQCFSGSGLCVCV